MDYPLEEVGYSIQARELVTERPTFNQENYDNPAAVHALAVGATEDELNRLDSLQRARVNTLKRLISMLGSNLTLDLITELTKDVILLKAWFMCPPLCDRDCVARQTLVTQAIDSDDKVGILKVLIDRYTVNGLVDADAILFDPLRQAIDKDRVRIVQLLLGHGAEAHVNRVDSMGQTALDIAQDAKRQEICEVLRRYGALTRKELATQQKNTNP